MRRGAVIALFSIFALMSGAKQLCAQHYVGAKAGYGGGTVRFYPSQDEKYRWGLYNGGISWKYYSEERVVGGIQADVEFMQKGYKIIAYPSGSYNTSLNRTDTVTHLYKVNSIIVPLAWQPHVYLANRKLRLFLNAAITASYNFSARMEEISATDGHVYYDEPREFILNRDNHFSFGLMGGLGLGYLAGRFEFFAEGRYHFGYSDIFRNSSDYTGNPFYSLRSPLDNLNASVGIYYRLGKGGILSPPKVKKPKTERMDEPMFERTGSEGGRH